MTALTFGKRYRITLDGVANEYGLLVKLNSDVGANELQLSAYLLDQASIEPLPDAMPRWQVGDVIAWDEANWSDGPKMRRVVMRIYTYNSTPYWRDAAAHPELGTGAEISSERVAELWDAGQLELVARDGRPWPKQ